MTTRASASVKSKVLRSTRRSDRITRVIIRRGVLFHTETPIPAGWIASVGDRITLSVSANEAKELEPSGRQTRDCSLSLKRQTMAAPFVRAGLAAERFSARQNAMRQRRTRPC
jgi:hypothetical protein